MNDSSSRGKMAIIWFYSVNVKENCIYSAQKKSWAGVKMPTIKDVIKIMVGTRPFIRGS